ncbi:MAG: Holliday junction branch migration protein RuvA [Patescibacteria group bacterium]|nr:Holliday junction branch migration protein RuvA [Patescibacteria group bacterium]
MIGKIKGKLVEIDGNQGLLETTSGLFYQLYLPSYLLSRLKINQSLELYTHLYFREDSFILFGFNTKEEYQLFKELITVPGVGVKTAFAIISFGKVNQLIEAVKNNDVDYFTEIPGLGKKTALKIILELSSKLKKEFNLEKIYFSEEDKAIYDALISLGFNSYQVKKIIPKLPKNLKLEEKIKEALKMLK